MNVRTLMAMSAAAMLAVGCDSGSTEPELEDEGPDAIEVSPFELSLLRGDTATVTARLLNGRGQEVPGPVPGYTVVWSSGNSSVASVGLAGRVTARQIGSTEIEVSAGALSSVYVPLTVSPRTLQGLVSFDHAGDRSGRYEVSQTFQFDQNGAPTEPDWAVAYFDSNFGSWDIVAFEQTSGTTGNLAWLWIYPDPTGGSSFEWDPVACAGGNSPSCPAGGVVAFGINLAGSGGEAQEIWWLTEGELSVSAGLPGDRLVASFTADGRMWNDSSEVYEGSFTVTSGSVDVDIVPEAETSPPQGTSAGVPGVAGDAMPHPIDSLRRLLPHLHRHRPLR